MFKTLSGFILLTLTFLCCQVANGQVIENDVKLLDLRTDSYGLEVDYLLEARLAQGEEIGGLVAFGLEDLGQGDYRVSYFGIAQKIAAFEVQLGTVFDTNYVLNNTPLAVNDNSINNTVVHINLGESLYFCYVDDDVFFDRGITGFDPTDGYGWAEIRRTDTGLELMQSATAESFGIVVGTTVQALEPLYGDVNQDTYVDFRDIAPFIELLSSSGVLVEADTNQDGLVDFRDISSFINLLTFF